MTLIASKATLKAASAQLTAHDPFLAPVIARVGDCPLAPHQDYYQALVDSIISQQLSVHAARSIEGRLRELFGGHFPSAAAMLGTDLEQLRSIGLSYAKGRYLIDLAAHVESGALQFADFDELSNAAIIRELTAVKGIGEWTAHMFLMFCMGRLDVLPVGDLGIRNGIRALYQLPETPSVDMVRAIAGTYHWHPYESVASWYVWQSLENAPAVSAA